MTKITEVIAPKDEHGNDPNDHRNDPDYIAKLEPAEKEKKREVKAINAEDFLNMEIPDRDLILAPWLPKQGLCMVYAPRGIGKTFFALNVAYAAASGGQFLSWEAKAPVKVLYIDGEMPARAMQERIRDIVLMSPKDCAGDYLQVITPDLQKDPMPSLSSHAGQLLLEPHIDSAELVIVDNLSTLCRGGVENEAESWLPVQQWALSLRARGKSVLFVHHAGKNGGQRGTSRREDILDTVINLKRPTDYTPDQGARFEVHFEKSRGFMGEDAEPLDVALINGPRGQEWACTKLEASTYTKVVQLHEEGLTPAEIARELEVNRSTVSRHLKKAGRGAK